MTQQHQITIRPMPEGQEKAVASLVKRVISPLPYYNARARREEVAKYTPIELAAVARADRHSVLVAYVKDTLAGFCLSKYDDGLLWLSWFGVDENFRGKGVGTALLRALEKTAARRRAHKIWCDTRTTNLKSQKVLENSGYRKIGNLTNHWYGQDFFLWEKLSFF